MPAKAPTSTPTPALTVPSQRPRAFAARGLRSLGFGVAIAVCLTLAFGFPFYPTLLQSVFTAAWCWFSIDSGRLLAARWVHRHATSSTPDSLKRWPGWGWMVPILIVGSVIGFSAGGALADWLGGTASRGYLRGSWSHGVSLLVLSLIPGVVITYWFYSRETIVAKEAAVQTAQRQAAEHQLKLLESQLEPHMLFNTLANLRVLIGLDPARAQAMLDQLISFLRATLEASRAGQHPLAAEFARLGDYLALMQVRMGERLQIRLDLPPELAGVPVPPLLLQPLVENGIKHGLEPKVAGGRIEVSARLDAAAGQLVLRVRDTGVGLSGTATGGTRFGMAQVRERLATLYGGSASLTLTDAEPADPRDDITDDIIDDTTNDITDHITDDTTNATDSGGTLATIRLPWATAP